MCQAEDLFTSWRENDDDDRTTNKYNEVLSQKHFSPAE